MDDSALDAQPPQPPATTDGFALPPRVPTQPARPVQSNIPAERAVRDALKRRAIAWVERRGLVPPMPMAELREHAARLREAEGLDPAHDDYVAVLLNNAAWHDTLATIPYDRRLLLLPKCLRVEEHCPAPFDEFGLLCKECGLCSIQDLTVEAERLGYAALVAEGSAIVRQLIETGRIEAVVGVSCLNVLERSFPHMEAAAVPGVAIPLLQDDCINCTVDMDWVWDVIHLTADDRTHRLDLDALRDDVRSWFTPQALDAVMGPAEDPTAAVARDWLARDGKRWRPYLATCVHMALACDGHRELPELGDDARKLAVAVECFHKASLIHDDLEDGDVSRYGTPTLHVEHGEAVAINAGDFLLGEGYRLLSELEVAAEVRVAMLRTAAEGHVTLCRGQGRELDWARAPRCLAPTEVLQIFQQKTAPAFEVALRLGALFARADDGVHDVLREFSTALGTAYQVRDDLEDFAGGDDPADLAALRPSLLLAIAARKAESGAERQLVEALWRRESIAGNGDAVLALLRERGVIDKASELLAAYEEQAVRSLRFLASPTLKGLLRRVVGKIFPRAIIEGYCKEFEARAGQPR